VSTEQEYNNPPRRCSKKYSRGTYAVAAAPRAQTNRFRIITSLQTRLLPKTTCSPSKKLSPSMVTDAPPWVHPSLGVMCFMHGVATGRGENIPRTRIRTVRQQIFYRMRFDGTSAGINNPNCPHHGRFLYYRYHWCYYCYFFMTMNFNIYIYVCIYKR